MSQRGIDATEPVVVSNIRRTENSAGLTLSADLRLPDCASRRELWFRLPSDLAPSVAAQGDPFLPVALVLARYLRRSLVVESDVSTMLLAGARRIMEIQADWAGGALPPIVIEATPAPRERRGTAAGLFFSGGVDSFYTLLRNVSRYPRTDARAISHLLLIHGYDITLEQTELFANLRKRAVVVADALDRRLVPVVTNAGDLQREVLKGLDFGDHCAGPLLASVGLALGELCHTLFISASNAHAYRTIRAWSSHPALDPLWSTEQTEFVHSGAEATKVEKTRLVASNDMALRMLRVCFENLGPFESRYNCGRCRKCLRTMLLLKVYGVLDKAELFPATLTPERVERLDIIGQEDKWGETLEEVRCLGTEPDLTAAMRTALTRSAWAKSRLGQADARVSRSLARIGLDPRVLRKLDRGMLGGLGMRLLRAGMRRAARGAKP